MLSGEIALKNSHYYYYYLLTSMVVIFTLVMLHLYVLDLMCNVIKYDCFVKQYEQMILMRLFGYRFFVFPFIALQKMSHQFICVYFCENDFKTDLLFPIL